MPGGIGLVLKGYPRLSEAFIAQEILSLERRGLRFEIFSMRGPREDLRQPVVAAIRAPVHYLPEWRLPRLAGLLRANGRALLRFPAPYLLALGHALIESLRRSRPAPMQRLLEAGWLVARHGLGAAGPLRHLHAHFLHAPAELAFYAARIAGLSYSATAHAKDIYTSRPRELAERINASRFVLTCTAYNRDFLASLPGVAGGKVHLAYHGVDLEAFAAGCEGTPAALGDLRRLVSVGRLVPKKGFGYALEALGLLRGLGQSCTWDLYGAGKLDAGLRLKAAGLGVADLVRFHGRAAHPEIIARLRQGGIYLCPSVEEADGDRDGIPNTLLEAMAMGLPVVATGVSAIPEAVRSGVEGLLVPQRDPRALCDAVLSLLRDPERARLLGIRARARVRDRFDAETCIEACAPHFVEAAGPRGRHETVAEPA